MNKIFKTTIAGRELKVDTGKLAQLANGAVLVSYGDTVVMSTATSSLSPREGIDFFPLAVDYEEKLYAVGKIPGGFLKREGKPSEKAILTGRVIDRQIRPLFPKDLRNDVAVVNTVMACDQDCSPEFTAIMGTSIAIAISDIPWNGPVGGVILGLVDGKVVINPNEKEREISDMYVTLSGTKEKIVMVEAGANEVPDEVMLDAIKQGHEVIKEICDFINSIVAEIGKPKYKYDAATIPAEIFAEFKKLGWDKMRVATLSDDKQVRDDAVNALKEEIKEQLSEREDAEEYLKWLDEGMYNLQKKVVRDYLYNEHVRVDGRRLDQIRPLSAEVDLLPRVHGSGLFQRGQTQVLTTCTLAPISEAQKIDGIDTEDSKRYMHHYNFPGYSVGEAKTSRGPGRREIGHGALAERSLVPVLPSEEEFPYAMRLVSEILMSNGSTSQGSVCGSTLALMAAGVPIKAPVAGISAGLIVDEEDDSKFLTFMDIQGIEDFYGDMDFKVAGTKKGITSIQVDIKVDGLSIDIIKEAFAITKKGREHIIDDIILKAISEPRAEVSKYAPKMFTTSVHPDKIRDVIGQGGKVINKIIEEFGVKIDIQEDGTVFVACVDKEAGLGAIKMIEDIVAEAEVGKIYDATVVKVADFGCFVEFLPGKQGLVHISKLDHKRVNKVEDVCKVGDKFKVKVLEIDKMGRINLSKKDAEEKPADKE